MRISDWSSDVCSSDLLHRQQHAGLQPQIRVRQNSANSYGASGRIDHRINGLHFSANRMIRKCSSLRLYDLPLLHSGEQRFGDTEVQRSEEHTSELPSLMRISYAVFCLTKKTENHLSIDLTRTLRNTH